MARAILAAVLLALAASLALAATDRQLLQSGVTCSKDIPACTERRCTLRTLNNKDTYVCLRCQQGFIAARQGSNVLQCVCPPGTVYDTVTKRCANCLAGNYCPGGNTKAVLPTDNWQGTNVSCNAGGGSGLTTLSTRSTKATDCVAKGGYVLPATRGGAAQQCTGSTYAPNNNRLKQCLSCQSGLEAPPTLVGLRVNKATVCQVPPGFFWELTVARECPQGLYREAYLQTTDRQAIKCKNCPAGWSTTGKGTTLKSSCSVLMPGYKLASVAAGAAATVTLDASFDPPATELCPIGWYYDGTAGVYSCTQCPYGSTTQSTGSNSVDDCMVPPGYYIQSADAGATGTMTKCPVSTGTETGYYRTGWVSYNLVIDTNGKTKCTSCGSGIPSEAIEDDENPLAASDSKVAATSASCYILAGWGMTFDPADFTKFRAVAPCPANSYGVAIKTNGLFNSPCKTCAKGLYSVAASKNISDCKNLGGFGYATEGSTQCPDDTFAVQDSMAPCTRCPAGRMTNYVPGVGSWQDSADDCKVPAGFGVYSASAANPFNPTSVSNALTARACPVGFFAAGEDPTATSATANPKCQACADHTSTFDVGSASCDACAAGYGKNGGSSCAICPYGKYSAGSVVDCSSCPSTDFNAEFGGTYTSTGLTVQTGLTGPESCVPKSSQVASDVGSRLGLPDGMFTAQTVTGATDADYVANCVATCAAGKVCVIEANQDETLGNSCRVASFDPTGTFAQVSNKAKLYYKLPLSDTSAASVEAKTVASGIYAIADVDGFADNVANGTVGTSTDPAQVEVANAIAWGECTDEADCKAKCTANSACWGFVFHPSISGAPKFALRGGEPTMGTRSFFGIPDGAAVSGTPLTSLGW